MAGQIDIRNFVNVSIVGKKQTSTISILPKTFNVVLNYNSSQGNIITSSTSGVVGETVSLTFNSYRGYIISSISINGINQPLQKTISFKPMSGINRITVEYEKGFNKIEFVIDDIIYEADENMTWLNWVNSEYNINGYAIDLNNYVENSSGAILVDNSNNLITSDMEIVADATYTTASYTSEENEYGTSVIVNSYTEEANELGTTVVL